MERVYGEVKAVDLEEIDYYAEVMRIVCYVAKMHKLYGDEGISAKLQDTRAYQEGPARYSGVLTSSPKPAIGIDGAYGISRIVTPRGQFNLGGCWVVRERDEQIKARLGLVPTIPGRHIPDFGQIGPFYSVTKPVGPIGPMQEIPKLDSRSFVDVLWWEKNRDLICHRAEIDIDRLTAPNMDLPTRADAKEPRQVPLPAIESTTIKKATADEKTKALSCHFRKKGGAWIAADKRDAGCSCGIALK